MKSKMIRLDENIYKKIVEYVNTIKPKPTIQSTIEYIISKFFESTKNKN